MPQGPNLVTKCPLIIQVFNSHESDREYAYFSDYPAITFSVEQLPGEISKKMALVSGENSAISSQPVKINIHSKKMPCLTIIDLPGLTRIPTIDQPSNIDEITFSICNEHISPPNAIIIAVAPANVDLVTSEALKLAQKVDPNGHRTVLAITKLDLAENRASIPELLQSDNIRFKCLKFGVVLKSQAYQNLVISNFLLNKD